MQAFTATNDSVTPGILLKKTDKLGWSLVLGEYGRGRWQEHVKLDSRKPPTVQDNGDDTAVVTSCGVIGFEAAGRQRHAFIPPNPDDNRVLVRINTGSIFMKNQSGKATVLFGRPRLIVSGWGAFGDHGQLGTWEDGLWTLKHTDAILVRPSGGQLTEPYVLYNDNGTLTRTTFEDFRLNVLPGWLESITPEALRNELKHAELRKDNRMAEILRTVIPAEMSAISPPVTA
jgi:hypothetical protein